MWILVLQRLFVEAFLDVFYFPLWWYTGGARKAALWCWGLFQFGNRQLAPALWLQNIFVPMFGQYDWQGRIISFFMRLVQIFFRSIALVIWLVFCIILFFIWFLLPLAVVYGLLTAIVKK